MYCHDEGDQPGCQGCVASGFMSLETKSELLREGAKGFILKPYNLNEVLQIVREVLDEKESSHPMCFTEIIPPLTGERKRC